MQDDKERMNYQMIGEDHSTIDEKLQKYSGVVSWDYIRPHFKAGNVLYIDPTLDMQTVGKTISLDDKDQVDQWLKSGDLIQPSEPHGEYWEKTNPQFLALIVTPFILIQPA